ncbi:Proliferating cell nuclear antigen [Glycine soja]|uniref:Proliferating cell nuclear antigen n=1 Tax=Glycine soja TaxID=3848 RepID=A0A0B2QW14_GLYSO|nr:Proliferating cell nuclear antigen [Glycine soja]
MVEARRVQGSVLKHMVEAINEMSVNCANFNFSRAGFSLLAMDPTQTAMAEIFLRSDIERKLACCSKDSCAVVCVIAQDLISHFMMNLVDIDTKPVLIHSEAQYYHAIVKMPSAKFSRICTDLSIFGDTVSIEVTEEGVGFSTKRDIGTSIIFCWHNTSVHKADEEATAIEMTQTVSLNFGLTFLNSFTKATPLSNTVTIFLSNQLHLPVVFQYQIGEKGHLRFYLKPIKPEY